MIRLGDNLSTTDDPLHQKHEFHMIIDYKQTDRTNITMGLNSLKFSKKKNNYTPKLLRTKFLNNNIKSLQLVTLFMITTNKNTGNSHFIVHLRRDDLLVIFYTRRHEFLHRLSCRHSPRSLSIISQQSWYAIIKVFSNE